MANAAGVIGGVFDIIAFSFFFCKQKRASRTALRLWGALKKGEDKYYFYLL